MQMSDSCPYCAEGVDQGSLLQCLLDEKADGQVDWLAAKRRLQEWQPIHHHPETATLSSLKKHVGNHIEAVEVPGDA